MPKSKKIEVVENKENAKTSNQPKSNKKMKHLNINESRERHNFKFSPGSFKKWIIKYCIDKYGVVIKKRGQKEEAEQPEKKEKSKKDKKEKKEKKEVDADDTDNKSVHPSCPTIRDAQFALLCVSEEIIRYIINKVPKRTEKESGLFQINEGVIRETLTRHNELKYVFLKELDCYDGNLDYNKEIPITEKELDEFIGECESSNKIHLDKTGKNFLSYLLIKSLSNIVKTAYETNNIYGIKSINWKHIESATRPYFGEPFITNIFSDTPGTFKRRIDEVCENLKRELSEDEIEKLNTGKEKEGKEGKGKKKETKKSKDEEKEEKEEKKKVKKDKKNKEESENEKDEDEDEDEKEDDEKSDEDDESEDDE